MFCFLFVGDGVAAWAYGVYCYAFVFVVDYRVNAAACGPVRSNRATLFFWVVKNAVSMAVFERGVTVFVEADEKVSGVALLF